MACRKNTHITLAYFVRWGLCAWLFLLPWQTIYIFKEYVIGGAKWQYGTVGIYATECLGWIIIGMAVIEYIWKKKKYNCIYRKWTMLVVICIAVSSISADSLLSWIFATRYIQVMILAAIIIAERQYQKIMLYWFMGGAVLQSVLGISEFIYQISWSSSLLGISEHLGSTPGTAIVSSSTIGRWVRAYAAFPHPNIFGGYMAIALILYLLAIKKRIFSGNLFSTIVIIMLSLGLFCSLSRSAWLACIIGGIYLLIHTTKKQKEQYVRICAPALVICTIYASLYAPLLSVRVGNEQSIHEQHSIEERQGQYNEWWTVMNQSPLFGNGIGEYTYTNIQIDEKTDSEQPVWEYQPIHNSVLLIIAEFGLLGSMAIGGVIITFLLEHKKNVLYIMQSIFLCIPILLLDHYLVSSYIGISLGAVYLGLFFNLLYLSEDNTNVPI